MNAEQLSFDDAAPAVEDAAPLIAEDEPRKRRSAATVRCKNCDALCGADNPQSAGGGYCKACIGEIAYAETMLVRYANNHWICGLDFPSSAFPGKRRGETAREYLERDAERFCEDLYDYAKAYCWSEYLEFLFNTY